MYGIYANIWGILMVNVAIYGIHGSYGKDGEKKPQPTLGFMVRRLYACVKKYINDELQVVVADFSAKTFGHLVSGAVIHRGNRISECPL